MCETWGKANFPSSWNNFQNIVFKTLFDITITILLCFNEINWTTLHIN